ncbi:MAG: glycine zipper domain-containing protein [Planctomycetota bacterium]
MKSKAVASSLYVSCALVVCICALVMSAAGCQTKAQTGAAAGAGIGALAGQAIGGNTEATLIGAGIGAGVGYIIGNEQDKKAAQNHDYSEPTPLTGSKWKVISLAMQNKPQYEWITVEFRPDGKVVTTRLEPGGTKTITEEKYRVVGKTLIVHKTDYIINAEYQVYGNELIVTCDRFRAVLGRI